MNISRIIPGRRAGGPMEPSGSVWPNGEFTIGYAPCGGLEKELSAKEYADRWTPPLGLALAANSHRDKDYGAPARGSGGITSYGRRLVRNSVEMLERAYGHTNLSFATLTLPNLEYEEFWNVASNWSEIVRIFYQAFGRKLRDKLLPGFYVGVTELQPERSKREGVPALHIHFVFVGRRRNEKGWRIHPHELRSIWKRTVGAYLWNDYDWSFSENVQAIRHTAAGYLSKYMSKGSWNAKNLRSDGTGWRVPSAWYNISLRLKQKVCEKVRRDPDFIEAIERAARDGSIEGFSDYFYAGVIPEMPGVGPHYFVGRLTRESYESLCDWWKCEKLPGG